jgi:hypothetical protein
MSVIGSAANAAVDVGVVSLILIVSVQRSEAKGGEGQPEGPRGEMKGATPHGQEADLQEIRRFSHKFECLCVNRVLWIGNMARIVKVGLAVAVVWFQSGLSLLDNSHTVYISNEIQMPRIGFGTAALGQQTRDMTCEAINAGVRLIDSAQAREWYREDGVGLAIKECYNEKYQSPLVVVTKIHPRSYL